jgi:predicted outer membrane repeat protein
MGPLSLVVGATGASAAGNVTVTCATLDAALDPTMRNDGDVVTLQDDHLCTAAHSMPTGKEITLQGGDANQGFDGTGITQPSILGSSIKSSTLRNLTFRHGGYSGPGPGGAVYIFNDSTPQLINLRFFDNHGQSGGGAVGIISNSTSGTTLIDGCTFGSATDPTLANTAPSDGGAIYVETATSLTLTHNVVAGNGSTRNGGGAFIQMDSSGAAATLTMTANSFLRNTASENGGGASITTRDPIQSVISDNLFQSNRLTTADNTSGRNHLGGGLFLGYPPVFLMVAPTAATQSGNSFDRNVVEAVPLPPSTPSSQPRFSAAFDYGGGGEWVSDVQVASTRDQFTNNSVADSPGTAGTPGGGGLGLDSSTRSTVFEGRDLVAAGNTVGAGGNGGGIYVGLLAQIGSTLRLFDSTVAGNSVATGGTFPAISGDPGDTLNLTNTIAAANLGSEVQVGGFSTMTATYTDTCLAAGAPMTGAGNFCADPKLVNPGAGIADVHETATSPTRNTGSNGLVPAGLAVEYAGTARIVETTVDVGADEFEPPVAAQLPAVTLPLAGAGPSGSSGIGVLLVFAGALLVALALGRSLTGDRRRN